jgi:glucan biosynthesis protein
MTAFVARGLVIDTAAAAACLLVRFLAFLIERPKSLI